MDFKFQERFDQNINGSVVVGSMALKEEKFNIEKELEHNVQDVNHEIIDDNLMTPHVEIKENISYSTTTTTFQENSNLKNDIVRPFKSVEMKCSKCEFSTKFRWSLKRHISLVHKVSYCFAE